VAGLLTSVTGALARLADTDMTALTAAGQAECLHSRPPGPAA
jgi:hypothetical protein